MPGKVQLRASTAAVLGLVLTACAGVPPPQYVDPDDLGVVLGAIKAREQEYAAAAARWDNLEPYFSLPMIGAAAAGVATLFFVHNPAKTNVLEALGIGAGTYALGWSSFNPIKRESAYRLGLRQTGCLYQTGRMLSDQANPALAAKKSALQTASEDIRRTNADADSLTVPVSPTPSESLALAALTQARGAAATALDTAAAELDVANHPGAYLAATLIKIDNQIYADAKGEIVNLSDALAKITAASAGLTTLKAAPPPPSAPAAAPGLLRQPFITEVQPPSFADKANALAKRLTVDANTINDYKGFVAIETKAEACALIT